LKASPIAMPCVSPHLIIRGTPVAEKWRALRKRERDGTGMAK
jgi:hypothetical protein